MSQRASGGGSLWDILDVCDLFGGLFEHPVLAVVLLLAAACIWLEVSRPRGTEVVR